MATIESSDWGAGIYRGREAPAGAAYDLLNALIDDEGQPFLRGKSAYFISTSAGAGQIGLVDAYLAAGQRTVLWDTSSGLRVWSGSAWVTVSGSALEAPARAVGIGGSLFMPSTVTGSWLRYGGSLKTAAYLTGTVSVSAGSTTVTGVGTSWLANVDAGMTFVGNASGWRTILVGRVISDTSLELREPAPVALAGATYSANHVVTGSPTDLSVTAHGSHPMYLAAVGTPARLIVGYGNRAYFSEPGRTTTPTGYYHELPSLDVIIGADAIEDTAVLFTTNGVWTIQNMAFDPVDDVGNVQHVVQQVNRDLVLWGDSGIAAWDSVLVVPAIDDVYLFSVDGQVRSISEGIRSLYRAYVRVGYRPGIATVHRGHYFLPILNGTTLYDVLVCRLDRPFGERGIRPWTRWAGHAASVAYAQRVGASTRAPKLLGVDGQRVSDLTTCMEVVGGSGQDADGTTPTFRVDFNDDDLGPGIRPNTAEKVRFVYEMTGGSPSVSVSYATGPAGGFYSAATLKRGGGVSDGTDYSAWRVGKKAERIRFRFECSSQVTSLVLRRREVTIRPAAQN